MSDIYVLEERAEGNTEYAIPLYAFIIFIQLVYIGTYFLSGYSYYSYFSRLRILPREIDEINTRIFAQCEALILRATNAPTEDNNKLCLSDLCFLQLTQMQNIINLLSANPRVAQNIELVLDVEIDLEACEIFPYPMRLPLMKDITIGNLITIRDIFQCLLDRNELPHFNNQDLNPITQQSINFNEDVMLNILSFLEHPVKKLNFLTREFGTENAPEKEVTTQYNHRMKNTLAGYRKHLAKIQEERLTPRPNLYNCRAPRLKSG